MKLRQIRNKIVPMLLAACVFLLVSCQSSKQPLPTVSHVDLESFMGTWYVVGYTPLFVDGKAHNATEHYYLEPDGSIQATSQYRNGAFEGPLKTYRPTISVHNKKTHAEWRIQFIWPFKAAYLILHYDEAAGETIVGHPNRKYAWIMLREPEYEAATYERLMNQLVELGYNRELIKRLPQDWSSEVLRKEMMQETAPFAIGKKEWRERNK
jgi:apolipoprotein D and lipocalin family protein